MHPDRNWMDDASCLASTKEEVKKIDRIFFPVSVGGRSVKTDWSAARVICNKCPVRRQCLDYAIRTESAEGMFGGLTPSERAELARKQAS